MRFFQDSEIRCKCNRPECDAPLALHPLLAQRLDILRESLGRPLILTSGLRCAAWNGAQGGAPSSRHLTGQAVDIACDTDAARYELLAHVLIRPVLLFPFVELAPKHLHLDIDDRGPRPLLMLAGG